MNLIKNSNYNLLSPTEKTIYKLMMNNKLSVPFLMGKTGIGKSAVINSIVKKMDWGINRFFCPTETEAAKFGLFPTINEKNKQKYVTFIPGDWVHKANNTDKEYYVLFFDELNRANEQIMAAVMGIFNERLVGDVQLNSNVIIVGAGNLGEEDDNNVEEFDAAQWNRLTKFEVEIDPKEWIEWFGKDNMWKPICDYILAYPTKSYIKNDDPSKTITRRNWELYSNYVGRLYNCKPTEVSNPTMELINELDEMGKFYLGEENIQFISYLKKLIKVTPKDVLENKINRKELKNLPNPVFSGLFNDTIEIVREKMNERKELNMGDDDANEGLVTLIKSALIDQSRDELLFNFLAVIQDLTLNFAKENNLIFREVLIKMKEEEPLTEEEKNTILIHYNLNELTEYKELRERFKEFKYSS